MLGYKVIWCFALEDFSWYHPFESRRLDICALNLNIALYFRFRVMTLFGPVLRDLSILKIVIESKRGPQNSISFFSHH